MKFGAFVFIGIGKQHGNVVKRLALFSNRS